jgi:hypothetical protein
VFGEAQSQYAAQMIAWKQLWALLLAPPAAGRPLTSEPLPMAGRWGESGRESEGHSPVSRQTSGTEAGAGPTQPIIRHRGSNGQRLGRRARRSTNGARRKGAARG